MLSLAFSPGLAREYLKVPKAASDRHARADLTNQADAVSAPITGQPLSDAFPERDDESQGCVR